MVRLIYYSNKTIKNCVDFSFVKGLTPAYIVETSPARNKYLTSLLKEDNDPISTKSFAQILSLNLVWTLLHLNFLIPGFCNS